MRQVNNKRSLVSGGNLRGAKRLLMLQALLASICIWMGLLMYVAGPEEAVVARGMMVVSLMPALALVFSPSIIWRGLKALMSASMLMLLALTATPGALLQGTLFVFAALTCAGVGLWLGSGDSPARDSESHPE